MATRKPKPPKRTQEELRVLVLEQWEQKIDYRDTARSLQILSSQVQGIIRTELHRRAREGKEELTVRVPLTAIEPAQIKLIRKPVYIPIEGSSLFRDICNGCKAQIRVDKFRVGMANYCERCEPTSQSTSRSDVISQKEIIYNGGLM